VRIEVHDNDGRIYAYERGEGHSADTFRWTASVDGRVMPKMSENFDGRDVLWQMALLCLNVPGPLADSEYAAIERTMTGMTEYDETQDRRDTAEENHDRALARRDRIMDRAPAGTPEPGLPDMPPSTVDVLPRDLDDHPDARDRVNQLAELYDSVEVDRLPPMGALHWLLRCHKGQTVYVCRVTADGRLLSVQR
jgi:hypothetical protein